MEDRDQGWRVGGASVRGASHIRKGAPNQDALDWTPRQDVCEGPILAVSDGHGSDEHFRSEIGSRLAVEAAIEVLGAFARECRGRSREQIAKKFEATGERILAEWRRRVDRDIESNPLPPDAPAKLDNRYLPYGATLAVASVLPECVLILQLGDGDILTCDADGVVDRPLPQDEGLFGEQTYSLCMPNPSDRIRCRVIPRTMDEGPDFVMLSTDGLAKSFSDERSLRELAKTWRFKIVKNGLPSIQGQLGAWLSEASARGSGDDISLGFMISAKARVTYELEAARKTAKRSDEAMATGFSLRLRAALAAGGLAVVVGAALAAAALYQSARTGRELATLKAVVEEQIRDKAALAERVQALMNHIEELEKHSGKPPPAESENPKK